MTRCQGPRVNHFLGPRRENATAVHATAVQGNFLPRFPTPGRDPGIRIAWHRQGMVPPWAEGRRMAARIVDRSSAGGQWVSGLSNPLSGIEPSPKLHSGSHMHKARFIFFPAFQERETYRDIENHAKLLHSMPKPQA